MIFQIVATSRDMGITISEFLQLSDDEKAMQIVFSNLTNKMEQVNEQDKIDQMNRNKARRK